MQKALLLIPILVLLNGCTSLKRAYVATWNAFDPPATNTVSK